MSKTFWDIKAKVWNLLGQKSTSITFSDSVVGSAVNNRILDFLRWRITSLIDPNRIFSAWELWIREGSQYLRTILDSNLTADMAIGANVISCSTTNLLSSGWVEIGWEVFSYSAKTSTQLTWVSPVATVLHEKGAKVIQLYAMPANFEKPIEVKLIDESSWDTRTHIPYANSQNDVRYEIIKTSTANLLKISGLDSNSFVQIVYSKTYTELVNDSDICVIPDHYWETVIAFIVAGELGLHKGIPNAQNLLVQWYANLQNCYQYFNSETNSIVKTITPKAYNFYSIKRQWRIIR